MADWDPEAPDTIGLPWLPGSSGQKVISTPYQSLAWRFPSTATETVTDLLVSVDSIDTAGAWIAEVYESGDEVAGTVNTSTFRPTADVYYTNWYDPGAAQTNLWDEVNGTTYDPARYVYLLGDEFPSLTFNFGTSSWPLGARVTELRLSMVTGCQESTVQFTAIADIGGTDYAWDGEASVGTENQTVTFTLGEINPDTLLPWTAADIVAFSSGDALGVTSEGLLIKTEDWRIFQMWLEVDWCQENRIAVSVEEIDVSTDTGWTNFGDVVNPNLHSVTEWAKVNGTDYVVLLRNLGNASESYNGTMRLPWLSSGEALPTGWEQSYLPVDATGLVTVPFDDYDTPRIGGLLLTVSTPGDSADGQPWSQVDGYVDQTTEQQITTLTGGTYERLRFGWLDTTAATGITPPAVDLEVKVKRQSDDVQFGSTETFTTAELQAGTLLGTAHADPDGVDVEVPLYLIERDMTTPATLATTQYFVEFTGAGHAIAVNRPPEPLPSFAAYTNVNLDEPIGICEGPDGLLWFTSTSSNRVGKITTAGVITMYSSASFNSPIGICAGPDGNLWVASQGNDTLCKVTTAGVVTGYTSFGNIDGPVGVCAGPDGLIWTTNTANNKICKTTTGGVTTAYSDASLNSPQGICEGPDGLLWICSFGNSKIVKVTTTGTFTAYTDATNINGPNAICEGPDGNLWFTNYTGNSIGKITTSGTITTYTSPSIYLPYGIASDGTVLWFTSAFNDRVGYITTTGSVTTYLSDLISRPFGIVWGPDDGPWWANSLGDSIGTFTTDAAVGANATYDGTTDAATIGTLKTDSDYPVTLSTVPDPPDAFVVLATDTELLTATDTACGIDTIDYISITWTVTALGSSFGHYEIQRDNGDALGFQTIAIITDESVDEARDYESVRGTISYRMRVCRSTDDICSDWTATDTAVRDAAGPAHWLFTSNMYPDLTCAYNVTPSQSYGWPDAARQRIINHYGTDDKTRFIEIERRLTAFPLPLVVYSQGLTSDITQNQGVAPFYPLLELCSQTSAPGVAKTVLPYVAVIDPHGNSWLAAVTVDPGTVNVAESNVHLCTADITEITETPCEFDLVGEGS